MEYSTSPQPVTGKPSYPYHDEQPGLEVAPVEGPGLEVAPDTGLHVYQPERDAKEPVLTGAYPPGIYAHDAYPEVYYGDHQHGAGPALPAGSPTEKTGWSRRKWLIVGGVALLVIIAAIVGGVVGSRAAANNASEEAVSDEATSASATASVSAIASPTSASTSALPTATSIAKNSPLTAVSFRTAIDGSPAGVAVGFVIAMLYRDPAGTVMATWIQDAALEGEDTTTWTDPFKINPPTPLQNGTGLYMGGHCTASATTLKSGKEIVTYILLLTAYYISDDDKVNGFEYDFLKATEDPPPLAINDRAYIVRTGSRVATYWPWVAFQDRSGFVQISNSLADKAYDKTQLLEHSATPGTHLSVVPVSTDHEKIIDSSYGIFYQDAQEGLLVPVLPGTDGKTNGSGAVTPSWPPISKFPKIKLPKQGSFAAFSHARSAKQSDSDLVNTFVLYQDDNAHIKQVWTDDSETWKTSSPAALTKADMGTDITCLTPASSNNTYAEALYVAPQSKLTRCYFQREGFVVEVQQKGTDWSELGVLTID